MLLQMQESLALFTCGMLNEEQVLSEIRNFKYHSEKNYNLNFFCHKMSAIDHQALREWEEQLAPYYQAFSVTPLKNMLTLRVPFDEKFADALEPVKPPIISFHFSLPAPELVTRIKSWGTIVLSSATTKEETLCLQKNGADVVIAQGNEAGGHRAMFMTSDLATQLSTSELLTRLERELHIPVVAAGGIATAADIQQTIKLGAPGAQVGTSFLLCDEAKTTPVHRTALKSKNSKRL